jgi:hypothetical protein
MATLGKRAAFDAVKSFDLTTLSASYQAIGTALAFPSVMLKLVNTSAVAVTVSFDGVNDNEVIPAATTVQYNFGSNAQSTSGDDRLALPKGTVIYVKGAAAGGAGTLFIATSVYQGN